MTETETTCERCGETIELNAIGTWTNFGRVAMGAGHYATSCPDGVHEHQPAETVAFRLSGCTCGGIGDTGSHFSGCAWGAPR